MFGYNDLLPLPFPFLSFALVRRRKCSRLSVAKKYLPTPYRKTPTTAKTAHGMPLSFPF
jgi:hypothetical protein